MIWPGCLKDSRVSFWYLFKEVLIAYRNDFFLTSPKNDTFFQGNFKK
jgi:hypothetical protein